MQIFVRFKFSQINFGQNSIAIIESFWTCNNNNNVIIHHQHPHIHKNKKQQLLVAWILSFKDEWKKHTNKKNINNNNLMMFQIFAKEEKNQKRNGKPDKKMYGN